MTNPLKDMSTEELFSHKDKLVLKMAKRLTELGVELDYPYVVMINLRKSDISQEERCEILEILLEIESIKYTLCYRRVMELEEEGGA